MSMQNASREKSVAKEKIEDKDWIEGIDRRMEVMSAAPLVLSTPVSLLAENRITDKSVLFVRNIQDLAEGMTLEPLPLEGWEIELTGLINPYRVLIRAEDLLEMEQIEYEMILQCSGNGRNKYPGIPEINLHTINLKPFLVSGIKFIPIEVMHYKLPVLGFRIGDFTYITDAKTISEQEKRKIKGTKTLVINALQIEKHISHFTFVEAIAFAKEIGADKTYFTHISHRLGRHASILNLLPKNITLAYDGLVLEV